MASAACAETVSQLPTSASQSRAVEPGLGKLERLQPEGSSVHMYMAELNHNIETANGNPVTSNNVLFAVPRKLASSNDSSEHTAHSHDNGHHGNDTDGHDNSQLDANGEENSSSSSCSESDAEESEGESSSGEEEEEVTDEVALKLAGVDLDLDALGTVQEAGGVAPVQLLSEFVSCCVRDEYRAALILCKKVLEFEPSNSTAQEFLPVLQERLKLGMHLPVLQERLKLDEELSTESSETSSDSSDSSHDGQAATCHQTSHDLCSR